MSKGYKDDQLKKEINQNHSALAAVIKNGHVKNVKGYEFDPKDRYLLIFKHGNWYTYRPDGTQLLHPVESRADANRIAKNFFEKQKVSQTEEIQKKTLQEAIQKMDQATENTQESTQEEIEGRKEEKSLYAEIYEESELTGESPIDIIKDRRKEDKISSEEFSKMMALFGKKSRAINEADIVESNIETRRGILEELKNPRYKREGQEKAELELLSDNVVGSPELSEKMALIKENFPELASDITLPMLQRMVATGKFDEVIAGSRPLAEAIRNEAEQIASSRPTWEQSQKIFENKYKPNMAYPQLSPYRNAVSNIAASGQAAGSTGFENARNAEQRAITREDFDFNRDLYRIMNEDWQNRGKGIDMLASGAKQYQETLLGPIKEGQDQWQKGYNQEKENQLEQDKMNMGVAEGDLKNELLNMQNKITLNDRLNVQDDETYNWIRNMGNEIYQLKEFKEGKVIENEGRRMELLQFENSLWQQRAQIESLLRRMNNEEAAIALSQERSKESWTQKALKYLPAILTVAGGIAGGFAGGPAGAIQGASLGGNIGTAISGGTPNYSNIPTGNIFQQPNPKQSTEPSGGV